MAPLRMGIEYGGDGQVYEERYSFVGRDQPGYKWVEGFFEQMW